MFLLVDVALASVHDRVLVLGLKVIAFTMLKIVELVSHIAVALELLVVEDLEQLVVKSIYHFYFLCICDYLP